MRYKLLRGSHGRVENGANVVYKPGQEIDLSPEEVKNFGDRIELVPETVEIQNSIQDIQESVQDWDFISGETWRDAVALVDSLESEDDVRAVLRAERIGKGRQSVIRAAKKKLEKP